MKRRPGRRGMWGARLLLLAPLLADCREKRDQQTGARAPTADAAAQAETAASRVPRPGDPARGEKRFGQIGCNGCHEVNGVGGAVGPPLTGVGARPSRDPARWPTAEAYIRASIREPGAYVVPGYTADMPPPAKLGLSAQDIEDLVAYLMTLR